MDALHPIESTARLVENIIITGKNSHNFLVTAGCMALSRLISLTVFPIFLTLELVFKKIPELLCAIRDKETFKLRSSKVTKVILGLLATPLSIKSPEGITGHFLKARRTSNELVPFGVEREYGRSDSPVFAPKTEVELQLIISNAKRDSKQISILGAGMSQGTQTIPVGPDQVVVDMRHFNRISLSDHNTAIVGAGATWEELQVALDEKGKSVLVKQASDIFSIGGSIGVNCHGWAHEIGPMSSTVCSLKILDASGDIKIVYPSDELFRCMFGTFGYFGIVLEAELKITENDIVVQKSDEIDIKDFATFYKTRVHRQGIPLFGGRLSLDPSKGPPLRKVCMVRYEKDQDQTNRPSSNFTREKEFGRRIERIGLRIIAHVSTFSFRKIAHLFWKKEKQAMMTETRMTRNEALHPPINAFRTLHNSNLHAEWLQEYFLTEEELPKFLEFLGDTLYKNRVRLINATIRPVPKDEISILPYAEKDRYAVVICFAQMKTEQKMEKTRKWIEEVQEYLVKHDGVYYQAYMPFASRDEFQRCYNVDRLRALKKIHDPGHLFGNAHTAKYFDRTEVTNHSPYRTVFQTSRDMQKKFVSFLCTIFYQLDEKKVLREMEKILTNSHLTDDQIYTAICTRIPKMKKFWAPLLQLKALSVLKRGMGRQAALLLKKFNPKKFCNYLEIYDRRYLNDIRKAAFLPLDGQTIGATDTPSIGLRARIEAGALFSRYPYKDHIPSGPINSRIRNLDLVACLGGLHHTKEKDIDPFLHSLAKAMRPGAAFLFRDHNITLPFTREQTAIVSVVHSFVNAANEASLTEENNEVREFKSLDDWEHVLNGHGFIRFPESKRWLLSKDPTENRMTLFVKAPQTLVELREAATYLANTTRPKDGTKATWIEWGNVRFAKAHAEFIQTHHSYAFDYIGHMKQHITHFKQYMKGRSIQEALKADNLAMNLFILITTIMQCSLSYLTALPSRICALIKHGQAWQNVAQLSRLEIEEAKIEKEYSEFIDHTPFYEFPYLSKIRNLWKVSKFRALTPTIGLILKALISAPIRASYKGAEPELVSMIIFDPRDELKTVVPEAKIIYSTPSGHKLLFLPRYRPFTQICKRLADTSSAIKIIEIGGQKSITLDLLLEETDKINPAFPGVTPLYDLPKLQDPAGSHYTTCEATTEALLPFIKGLSPAQLQYIHE